MAARRVSVDGREAAARLVAAASGLSIEDARRAVAVGDAARQGVELVGSIGAKLLAQLGADRAARRQLDQVEMDARAVELRIREVLSDGRRLAPGDIEAEVVEAEIVDEGPRVPRPAPVTPKRFR